MIRRFLPAAVSAVAFLSLAPALRAEPRIEQIAPGVKYLYEERKDPALRIHAVEIDLDRSRAQIDVAPGGPDPDGAGKWQTVLKPLPKIAEEEGFDIAVNGDFFSHLSGKDAEGAAALKEFQGDRPASVSGPAVSDGKVWAESASARPALVLDKKERLSIQEVKGAPANAEEAIAGSDVLVRNGKVVAPTTGSLATARHPRTAAGFRNDGRTLILLVVDGRQKDVSVGMDFKELAAEMIRLGCDEAVNLDGGGSSALVIRDPKSGELKVMNNPSDGRPRPVANALGVTLKKNGQEKTTNGSPKSGR